jgi:hypothetical protein
MYRFRIRCERQDSLCAHYQLACCLAGTFVDSVQTFETPEQANRAGTAVARALDPYWYAQVITDQGNIVPPPWGLDELFAVFLALRQGNNCMVWLDQQPYLLLPMQSLEKDAEGHYELPIRLQDAAGQEHTLTLSTVYMTEDCI